MLRGLVKKDRGDLDGALGDLEKAIEIQPRLAEAYNNRAGVHYVKGNLKAALDDMNRLIELKPRFAEAYYNRAGLHRTSGNWNAVVDDLNKAIEIKPRLALAYNNRGEAYRSMGRLDAALRDYNNAIALNSRLAEAYNNRGALLAKKGNITAALGRKRLCSVLEVGREQEGNAGEANRKNQGGCGQEQDPPKHLRGESRLSLSPIHRSLKSPCGSRLIVVPPSRLSLASLWYKRGISTTFAIRPTTTKLVFVAQTRACAGLRLLCRLQTYVSQWRTGPFTAADRRL